MDAPQPEMTDEERAELIKEKVVDHVSLMAEQFKILPKPMVEDTEAIEDKWKMLKHYRLTSFSEDAQMRWLK